MRGARVLRLAVAALALAGLPRAAWALLQTCTISTVAVNFGIYDPLSVTANTATGTVSLSCTLGLLSTWTVALGTGNSSNFAPRLLVNGSQSLTYNLYTSAAYSTVWGDGSGGTGTMSGTQVVGTTNVSYTVYGRIPARQDMGAGTYLDTIVVTVSY